METLGLLFFFTVVPLSSLVTWLMLLRSFGSGDKTYETPRSGKLRRLAYIGLFLSIPFSIILFGGFSNTGSPILESVLLLLLFLSLGMESVAFIAAEMIVHAERQKVLAAQQKAGLPLLTVLFVFLVVLIILGWVFFKFAA